MSLRALASTPSAFLLLTLLLGSASSALAHTRWAPGGVLEPRSTATNIKRGPCGEPRGTSLTVFEPGETIEVAFQSNIYHEGYFRIAFSPANDEGFNDYVLASDIKDIEGQENRIASITLPDIECENCTLQLIQTMLDRSPPSDYFSCANIALRRPEVLPDAPAVDLTVNSKEGNSDIVYSDTGMVTIEALLSGDIDGRSFEYDWSGSDARLVDTNDAEHIFEFDSTVLAEDDYALKVTVTDKVFSNLQSDASTQVSVLQAEPVVSGSASRLLIVFFGLFLLIRRFVPLYPLRQ